MVVSCSGYNCKTRASKDSGISFHKFPTDPKIRKKWVYAMRRLNFTATGTSKLCSKHFTPDCYVTSGYASRKRLRPDAIPSIFNFPPHLQKKVKKRKAPAVRTPPDFLFKEIKRPKLLEKLPSLITNDSPVLTRKEGSSDSSTTKSQNTPSITKKPKVIFLPPARPPNLNQALSDHIYFTPKPQPINFAIQLPPPTDADSEATSRKRRIYVGDFESDDAISDKFKVIVKSTIQKKNKKIKALKRKNKILAQKFANVKNMLEKVSANKSLLTNTSPDKLDEMLTVLKANRKEHRQNFKTFALNLHETSHTAYNYIRTIFQNVLPHTRTLQKWKREEKPVEAVPNETYYFVDDSFAVQEVTADISEERAAVETIFPLD